MSYAIYIGKNHSATGHAWLAGYGDEPSSHWLQITPRKQHAPQEQITVGVSADADLPGRLTQIPQAPETARNIRVDYSLQGCASPADQWWIERIRRCRARCLVHVQT
jgi:dipeptidase